MTIQALVNAHDRRSRRWHADAPPWSLLEWMGATAGELGEAANIAKKIKRVEQGLLNPDQRTATPSLDSYREEFGREVADTIHYLVNAATHAGVDLEQVLRDTFNDKSVAVGFPERL